ncbi:TetR/AcrR family transcriptional regulator [Sphingomonas sp. MMS24-J13]|uniref:TetR/AcrR family transcriptional regulator n=1 Tax=Sphingomonas sp. MMS24-J13 TaxID=3238686 RepID=UPI00384EFE51
MSTRVAAQERAEPAVDTAVPARPRGRRPAGAVSGREALLAAALSAFARNGYEATSLRVIAADAGVDMALVARLFGSKADLWLAVVDFLAERQAEGRAKLAEIAAFAAQDPAEAMRRFVRFYAEVSARGREVPAFIMQESGQPNERLDILVERLILPFRDACRPIFAAAFRAGVVNATDPVLFARMMFASISLPMVPSALAPDGGRVTPERVDAIVAQAIALFVRG